MRMYHELIPASNVSALLMMTSAAFMVGGGVLSLGLVLSIVAPLWPKLAKMKVSLSPPMIGQRVLSGNGTASHFCNLQINIYDSACSTGLSGSRPSGKIEERAFGGLQLSLCVELSLAGRTTQMCFVLS